MEQSIVKPPVSQADLDVYLKMLANKRIKTGGSDTTEQNHKLIANLEWSAIQRRHAND